MTDIETMAQSIRTAHDIDTLDAARDVVRVHVDQIADDPDLWDGDALTPTGVAVVATAIAQAYAGGYHSTVAQRLLDDIVEQADEIAKAEAAKTAATQRRDELIRAAMKTELRRADIAAAAGVKEARLHQINTGTR